MIKRRSTRSAAGILFVGALIISSFVDDGELADGTNLAATPLPQARFEVQRRTESLTLRGHTFSAAHEQELLRAADASFPTSSIDTHFEPLGITPSYWRDTTAEMVHLLATSSYADASLADGSLTIRAITTDEPAWKKHLELLEEALPAEIEVISDHLVASPNHSSRTICDRAFSAFDVGPINFEESSDRFKSSAIPRLQRVAALAAACRTAQIAISGHTDKSGNEAWNKQLSLSRAEAVADFLVTGGIDRERLQVLGVGSMSPIADDATRYGRSLNRRIEITFSDAD